jgi:hypothetical protein
MTYWNKYIDIAWYYSWNLFFRRFGDGYVFSYDDLIDRCGLFYKDVKNINKTVFIVYLQFFSDLCWLDNYLNQHWENGNLNILFNENVKIFENDIKKLSNALDLQSEF